MKKWSPRSSTEYLRNRRREGTTAGLTYSCVIQLQLMQRGLPDQPSMHARREMSRAARHKAALPLPLP